MAEVEGHSSGEPDPGLERAVARLEAAWRAGVRPRLEEFLPDGETNGMDALIALVRAEIRVRRERGDDVRVATYLARFPELRASGRRLDDDDDDRGRAPRLARSAAPAPTPSQSSRRLPDLPGFELLARLGQGGMGVVYQARHRGLGRVVALKMLVAGAHASPAQVRRFMLEARAAALLHHQNFAQVYDVGEHDGLPFMVLEYVGGGTLEQRLRDGPLAVREAASLAATLAAAMHFAHQRGLIHRDLKPANVLLEPDGTPKITDFGLVRQLGADAGLSESGAVIGTPRCMAPEQAEGRRADVGPAADVWALGTILYEMLAGRPAMAGSTRDEVLEAVLLHDPPPPSRHQPRVPRDLDVITLRCLRKKPAARYPSAEALAEDLRSFLAGEPIRARPEPYASKLLRAARRHPAQTTLVAAAVVAAVALAVGSLVDDAITVAALAVLPLLLAGALWQARLRHALSEAARERRRAEANAARVTRLLEVTRRMIEIEDLDELLRLLGETAAKLVDAERATIFLLDRERGELWSKVALEAGDVEIRLPLGQGIAGAVAATGETLNLPDAYADPRFLPEIDRRTGFRTRNLLTLPMVDRQRRTVGVFQVLNKRGGPFAAEDEEILAMLAASAAIVVSHGEQ